MRCPNCDTEVHVHRDMEGHVGGPMYESTLTQTGMCTPHKCRLFTGPHMPNPGVTS